MQDLKLILVKKKRRLNALRRVWTISTHEIMWLCAMRRIKMKIIVDKDDLICKLHQAFIALSHYYDAPGEREGVDEFC